MIKLTFALTYRKTSAEEVLLAKPKTNRNRARKDFG